MGIAQDWGPVYSAAGFVVIPAGCHDNPKKPRIGYRNLTRPLPPDFFLSREDYSEAEIALVCGASQRVLVDIDSRDEAVRY